VTFAINRLQGDSEVAVAYAAGMSNWQIVSPVMKLTAVVATAHLAFTALIQPASFREMRETVFSLRNDLAASLVREGSFTSPAKGLTIYARDTSSGGLMRDMLIHDMRNPEAPLTFTAKQGWIATVNDTPALIMRTGQVQQPKDDGAIDVLDYDQYVLELGDFFAAPEAMFLKSSDRFLGELFFIDETSVYDRNNRKAFLAEGHARLAGPLLNFPMALIALAALLVGDFRRMGYGRRIAQAAAVALAVRLGALGVQAACVEDPALNPLQYIYPVAVSTAALALMVLSHPRRGRQRAAQRRSPGPARAGAAAA
jgi:lipopolysaccharide export system permease protein